MVFPDFGSSNFKLPDTPPIGKEIIVFNQSSLYSAVVRSFPLATNMIGNNNNSYSSSVSVRPGETSRFIHKGSNYWKVEYIASTNVSFNGFLLDAFVGYSIGETVVNATTVTLNAATLNTNYPATAWPNGLKVYCSNIVGGGLVYIKTGFNTWVSTPITAVV